MQRQKLRLLGHILRADIGDPVREVVFEGTEYNPRIITKRRSGLTRESWILSSLTEAFDEHVNDRNVHFDIYDQQHMEIIITDAKNRTGIFETVKKPEKFKTFGIPNSTLDELPPPKTNVPRNKRYDKNSRKSLRVPENTQNGIR